MTDDNNAKQCLTALAQTIYPTVIYNRPNHPNVGRVIASGLKTISLVLWGV